MRAERFYADGKRIALEDVPIPSRDPAKFSSRSRFCGICHSDLSLINGTFPTQLPVVIQGHEASGTVARPGPRSDRLEGGRSGGGCRRPSVPEMPELPTWRRGELPGIQLMAFAYDGAWAEYTVAQAAGLTRVPDNVPLEQAAILADAVSTPYGAVVRTGRLRSGNRSACGVLSAAWAPTSSNSHGWSARAGDRWTSTRPFWIAPWNSARTTRLTRATNRCRQHRRRSPRAGSWMWLSMR